MVRKSAPRKSKKPHYELPPIDSASEAEEGAPDELVGEPETTALVPVHTAETELAAVSISDPLRRYFQEISRYALLSAEEELDLAIRMRDRGDLDAAKAMVTANLRLVVKIAMEYRNIYSNIMDLIQEGNIGLMKAVSKFDPTKGARLSYYSSWWIRSHILKYLLDNFRLVKIGTTQAQKKLFYQLMREQQRVEAQGLLPAPKLMAERLDVREKDVIEMQQRLSSHGSEVSLDAPVGDSEQKSAYRDLMPDDRESAESGLIHAQLIELIRERIPEFKNLLNEKERKVLEDRLLAEEPKTLQEVADLYGLTRERARQIEAKVIQKLRDFLQTDLAPSGPPRAIPTQGFSDDDDENG